MADKTGIEWTDASWNPIRGCSRVSEGCRHCYAETVAARFSGPGQPYEGLARRRKNGEAQWTGEVAFIEKHLLDPLRWQKPRRIFVNSMSDLFHEKVTVEQLDKIFAVMMLAEQHQFQILTKRPERMRAYLSGEMHDMKAVGDGAWFAARNIFIDTEQSLARHEPALLRHSEYPVWPLPNVWCGVSVENQEAADERIPLLLQTPAAVRFLSCEPLLGPVDLRPFLFRAMDIEEIPGWALNDGCTEGIARRELIQWIIVGGESGTGARACNLDWIQRIVDECKAANVACFVKQLGALPEVTMHDMCAPGGQQPARVHLHDRKGGDIEEWPHYLRVREFPQQKVKV